MLLHYYHSYAKLHIITQRSNMSLKNIHPYQQFHFIFFTFYDVFIFAFRISKLSN